MSSVVLIFLFLAKVVWIFRGYESQVGTHVLSHRLPVVNDQHYIKLLQPYITQLLFFRSRWLVLLQRVINHLYIVFLKKHAALILIFHQKPDGNRYISSDRPLKNTDWEEKQRLEKEGREQGRRVTPATWTQILLTPPLQEIFNWSFTKF